MPFTLKLYHCGVSGLKDRFDSRAKKHIDYQTNCAFSEWDKNRPRKISKEDATYGRPDPNSKSAARAQAAQLSIMTEIRYLCDMVHECAEWRAQDGRAAITFGKLFKIYITISDKLVGTLLRARKHGFVDFEGEMLYQRRDDSKVIELTRNINTIRARFGQRPLLTGGGEIQPWDDVGEEELEPPIPSGNYSRRNSTPGGNLQIQTTIASTPPPPPPKAAAVRPKIPKLSSRSQSLDAIGCIMFDSSATSPEDISISLESGAGSTSLENIPENVHPLNEGSLEISKFNLPMDQESAQQSHGKTATESKDKNGKGIEVGPRTLFPGGGGNKTLSLFNPMQSMETIEENSASAVD